MIRSLNHRGPVPSGWAAPIRSVMMILDRLLRTEGAGLGVEHLVRREFEAARQGREVTLVMFGLTGFDEFADGAGTGGASAALLEFARLLGRVARQRGLVVRSGWRADSFLVVLTGAGVHEAADYVAAVRQASGSSAVPMPSFEVGIAAWAPHLKTPDAFVQQAERALSLARTAQAGYAGPADPLLMRRPAAPGRRLLPATPA